MGNLLMVLPIVGKGFLGVFIVTGIIIAGVMLLNKLTVSQIRRMDYFVVCVPTQIEAPACIACWRLYHTFNKPNI